MPTKRLTKSSLLQLIAQETETESSVVRGMGASLELKKPHTLT